MDLHTVQSVIRPKSREALGVWQNGDGFLAGGTWLFSEPQPDLRRLIDLQGLGWPSIVADERGLSLAATCTIAELNALGEQNLWPVSPLIQGCCRGLLGSFKIWNAATVGGNICMALPAGPMIALSCALRARCTIWTRAGSERDIDILDLVTGVNATALESGDLLRQIDISQDALQARNAMRQISLSQQGRSGALLAGTVSPQGAFALTITAATQRPVRLEFGGVPNAHALAERIEKAVPSSLYLDDVHGRPDWRRHVTLELAEEIRFELEELNP